MIIHCGPGNIAGACGLALYGGRPSLGVCRVCQHFVSVDLEVVSVGHAGYQPVTDPESWPWLARWLSNWRRSGDVGIGDTVARMLAIIGSATMAEAYKRITGRDCGCADRRAKLNAQYPYGGNAGKGDR